MKLHCVTYIDDADDAEPRKNSWHVRKDGAKYTARELKAEGMRNIELKFDQEVPTKVADLRDWLNERNVRP